MPFNIRANIQLIGLGLLGAALLYCYLEINSLKSNISDLEKVIYSKDLEISEIKKETERYEIALERQTESLKQRTIERDEALNKYKTELQKPERFKIIEKKVFVNTYEGQDECERYKTINDNINNMDWNNF